LGACWIRAGMRWRNVTGKCQFVLVIQGELASQERILMTVFRHLYRVIHSAKAT
jgi:hypothetical protein